MLLGLESVGVGYCQALFLGRQYKNLNTVEQKIFNRKINVKFLTVKFFGAPQKFCSHLIAYYVQIFSNLWRVQKFVRDENILICGNLKLKYVNLEVITFHVVDTVGVFFAQLKGEVVQLLSKPAIYSAVYQKVFPEEHFVSDGSFWPIIHGLARRGFYLEEGGVPVNHALLAASSPLVEVSRHKRRVLGDYVTVFFLLVECPPVVAVQPDVAARQQSCHHGESSSSC